MGESECSQVVCRRHRSKRGGKTVLAWGLVAMMIAFASAARGQSTMTELLQMLDLSDYSPGLWPPPLVGQTARARWCRWLISKGGSCW
jgi:hypothetical protein